MNAPTPSPAIRRYPVPSSSLAEIGYDPGTRTMEVAFQAREGRPAPVWRYQPVTPETFAAILSAESIGQAFNKLVKQESAKPEGAIRGWRVGTVSTLPAGEVAVGLLREALAGTQQLPDGRPALSLYVGPEWVERVRAIVGGEARKAAVG